MGGIIVRPRSRILHGHDWVYSSEILKTFGSPEDGSVVSIKDGRDQLLGVGIYNAKSQIVVRRFSRRRQDLDTDFFSRRITQALEYREKAGCRSDLLRLVWSESDGLPGDDSLWPTPASLPGGDAPEMVGFAFPALGMEYGRNSKDTSAGTCRGYL